MSSRWLHFPAATGLTTPVNLTVNANTVSDPSSGLNQVGLTTQTFSGPYSADYMAYTSTPLRKSSRNIYIEWIIKLDTTQTYATKGDWLAANTVDSSQSSVTMNGNTMQHASVTIAGSNTGNLLRVRFRAGGLANTSLVTSIWNACGAGDPVVLKLHWT